MAKTLDGTDDKSNLYEMFDIDFDFGVDGEEDFGVGEEDVDDEEDFGVGEEDVDDEEDGDDTCDPDMEGIQLDTNGWCSVNDEEDEEEGYTPKKKRKRIKKDSVKTPKLKSEDRVKLIDTPNVLMVVPKTHPASVRYGSGSGWCTSVVRDSYQFKNHTENAFLIYVIFYDVKEDGKRGDEKYKIALHVTPDPNKPNKPKVVAYDKENNVIKTPLLKHAILTDEMKKKAVEHTFQHIDENFDFKLGDMVKGKKIPDDKWNNFKVEIRDDNFQATFHLKPDELVSGEVTKINEKSVRIDVSEVNITTIKGVGKSIIEELVSEGKLNVNLKNDFILKVENG